VSQHVWRRLGSQGSCRRCVGGAGDPLVVIGLWRLGDEIDRFCGRGLHVLGLCNQVVSGDVWSTCGDVQVTTRSSRQATSRCAPQRGGPEACIFGIGPNDNAVADKPGELPEFKNAAHCCGIQVASAGSHRRRVDYAPHHQEVLHPRLGDSV
jgi:hypothetical protein